MSMERSKRMKRWLSLVLVLAVSLSLAACGGKKRPSLSTRDAAEYGSEDGERRGGRREREAREEAPRPEGPIKINEVTADELAAYKIAGVGAATAENIVAYRDENGPFRNFEDLDKAPRVGPSMLEKFKAVGVDFGAAGAEAVAQVAASVAPSDTVTTPASAPARSTPASSPRPAAAPLVGGKVNINTAGIEELCTLKRVGPSLAQKIIDYRTAHGPFKTIEELDNVSGIGPALIEGIRDHVVLR